MIALEYLQGAFGLTTVEELQLAIDNCKDLIASTEVNTDRHKSLVTKLIQLRMKQVEAKVACLLRWY